MIGVPLRPIKSTEFAINIADIGVIDVAIDNVGHDLIAPAIVGQALRLSTPLIRQNAEFLQRETIQFARVPGRNSFPGQNLFRQCVSIQSHHFPYLSNLYPRCTLAFAKRAFPTAIFAANTN